MPVLPPSVAQEATFHANSTMATSITLKRGPWAQLCFVLSFSCLAQRAAAFQSPCVVQTAVMSARHDGLPPVHKTRRAFQLYNAPVGDDDDKEEEEEEVEPGKMRVSEIKAELDLRQIDYSDCFDKESLVERLNEARATGRADPSILEKFNKANFEQQFKEEKLEVKDEDIQKAVANDGTLPGGMTPDEFKKLTSNPEIMTLLQSTKMQEAMKLMMTGGREELERKLREDPELQETVNTLNRVMGTIQ